MRALLHRDLSRELSDRPFFVRRAVVASAPFLGFVWVLATRSAEPPDVIGRGLFTATLWMTFLVTVLFTPAVFVPVLARERAAGAFDVLRSTPLRPWQLVLGAWLARLAQGGLLLAATLPFITLALTFGGVHPRQLATGIAILALTMLSLGAAAVWVGAAHRDTASATRTSYLIAFIAVVGPHLLAVAASLLGLERCQLAFATINLPMALFEVTWLDFNAWPLDAIRALGLASFWLALTALFLGLAVRATQRGESGVVRASRGRRALSRVGSRWLEVDPTLWLGWIRGTGRAFGPLSWGIASVVVAAELVFAMTLRGVLGQNGETLWAASVTAKSFQAAQCLWVAGYFLLAVAIGLTSAATAMHRELQSNTLDVFFATPLTNRSVVRAMYTASVISAAPALVMAALHVVFAVGVGSYALIGGVLLIACMAIALAVIVANGFQLALPERSPTAAVLTAFRSLLQAPPNRRPPGRGTLWIFGCLLFLDPKSAVIALLDSAWPLGFGLTPMVAAVLGPAAPTLLFASVFFGLYYAAISRDLVGLLLPQRFMQRRDQRYKPLRYFDPDRDSGSTRPRAAARRPKRRRRYGRRGP